MGEITNEYCESPSVSVCARNERVKRGKSEAKPDYSNVCLTFVNKDKTKEGY